MITAFERFLEFVGSDRKPTLRAATFLEELANLGNPEAWRIVGASGQPAFENSWSNYGSGEADAAFYKHIDQVYIKGSVTGGSSATTIFTLPEGYRPAELIRFAVADSTSSRGNVSINTSGEVRVNGSSLARVSLNVSFRV